MIFFRTYAGTFLAVLLLIGCGGSASAQVSVSVYGGYVNLEGPRWLGYGIAPGVGFNDVVFDKADSSFYGLSIRSERGVSPILQGVEFYFEGLSLRETVETPAGSTVTIRTPSGGTSQTANIISASSVFSRTRHEAGLRKTILGHDAGWQLFATPFFGVANDRTYVRSENSGLNMMSENNIRWRYGGVDAGISRAITISPGITLAAHASLGAYLAVTSGSASHTAIILGNVLGSARGLDGDRWGYRAQGSLELKTRINEVLSASLLGQAVFWSDVPHASFASNDAAVSPGPIRLGYDDMTEFRMLLKLTAKIGSAP